MCVSSRPASAGRIRSSISLPQRGVRASIRSRSSSSASTRRRRARRRAPRPRARRSSRSGARPLAEDERATCAPPARSRTSPRSARAAAARARSRRAPARSAAGSRRGRGAARRSGAITPRLRRQQQRLARLAGAERRDVVRDHALEVVLGVRARRRGRTRGVARAAVSVTVAIAISLGTRCSAPRPRRRSRDAGLRPGATAARPVPDREVAGAPRGSVPRDRPRHVGLPGLRRGRGRRSTLDLGRAAGAAADRDHDRHPLRHALEPVRHELPRASTGASSRSSCKPKPSARFVARTRRAGLHGERAARGARGRALADRLRRPTASRSTPEHGWPLRLVDPGKLLLEERQVAARDRAARRPTSPGFWERYGYHNDADYWKEERYGF